MKKETSRKIIYKIVLTIQILLGMTPFVIDYLTHKKAGVMQYVYYNKFMFENGILNSNNLEMVKLASIILFIIFTIILIYCLKSKKEVFEKIQSIIGMVMSIVVFCTINMNYFLEKLAYHYFIIAFTIILIIQIIIVVCELFKSNKSQ